LIDHKIVDTRQHSTYFGDTEGWPGWVGLSHPAVTIDIFFSKLQLPRNVIFLRKRGKTYTSLTMLT